MIFLLLTLFGIIAGCGPSGPVMHEVSGKVTLSGQEVPGAQIQFVPDQRGIDAASAKCGADGAFRLKVPAGDHTVRILAQKLAPAPKGTTGPGGIPITEWTVDVIPPKYNANSKLRATIQAPTTKNFDLQP